jgi:hypothetical protein
MAAAQKGKATPALPQPRNFIYFGFRGPSLSIKPEPRNRPSPA